MPLSDKDVDHVARLARLAVRPEERERYRAQLNAVLEHAAGLAALDVEGVPPTAHILPLRNVWRTDAARPSLPRDEVLANAPDKAKGCFRVPRILE